MKVPKLELSQFAPLKKYIPFSTNHFKEKSTAIKNEKNKEKNYNFEMTEADRYMNNHGESFIEKSSSSTLWD